MADQVYRVEELRRQIVDLLRGKSAPMKAGAIAMALGLPLWAVFAGLDSAVVAELVVLDVANGYAVAPGVTKVVRV